MRMSRQTCDLELLRQIDNDILVQYEELLCLRAQLAGLLFPLKRSPPRKHSITRSKRSAARAAKLNGRPVSRPHILRLIPEH